jgi:hypothetical protein
MKHLNQCFGLLCLFLLPVFSFSQSEITGLVQDSKNEPLMGATVLLMHSADSLVAKGQLSGPNGAFSFDGIAAGSYFLHITLLGFEGYQSEQFSLLANAPRQNRSVITLIEKSTQLQDVQIVARTPLFTQKVDRLQINVSSSAVNAGSNALAVLQRSPGVLVNKQSNSISMSGKFGVIIMINGKVSRMPADAIVSMLEGMSAENIERIELIHTPPANFDAEGLAGIINIVLKQSADEGLTGSYSPNIAYGKREKYGLSTNFNYRKKILNLYGSYNYNFNHNPQRYENYRGFNRNGKYIETDGYSIRKPDLGIHNARLGADFQVSKKTVIGVVGGFFDRNWDMIAENTIDFTTDRQLDERVKMTTKEINHWQSFSGNANISHDFSADQKLSFDIDYIYYTIDNPSDYAINYVGQQGQPLKNSNLEVRKDTPIKIAVSKLDYSRNFKHDISFETGVKATRSLFDNDVRVRNQSNQLWNIDTALTSNYGLKESIGAAYTTLSFKLNKKTSAKAGLRYEYTDTNLGSETQQNIVDREYGSWFPSLYISRTISETQSLNINYSRRIWRPSYTQLAPYLIFYDPNTVQGGNPSLQPAFVQAIRADYRYKSISLTAEYNYESPSLRDVPFVDIQTNKQISRPENIGNTKTSFLVLGLPFQPTKWWQMQNNIFGAYQIFNTLYEGNRLLISTQFAGFNSAQTINLPKQWSIDVSGDIITANNSGIVRYRTYGTMNMAIQKKFSPQWGSITFQITDLLASANWYSRADQPSLNLLVTQGYIQAERTFGVTWTNKFGNTKLKDSRQRETGASDELRRL